MRPGWIGPPPRGRGAGLQPPNRFEPLHLDVLGDHVEHEQAERLANGRQVRTQVIRDDAKSVINRVDSPDLPFNWTLNPYRGCEHGCAYCYARPSHELLGYSSGLDFETRIMAKFNAPALLREELADPTWRGEPIVIAGVTDAYQPIESQLNITRGCLELITQCRQPISIVTKSRLILRDLDLLSELARHRAVTVTVSVTTLDNALAAKMEPRAASPRDRLWVIQRLASAGIPTAVMVAPLIPGLTDSEMPAILKAASNAGARSGGYVLLRLPHQVKELFDEWLSRHFPDRRERVTALMTEMRDGKLYDSAFNERLTGTGPLAAQIRNTFEVFCRRYQIVPELPTPSGQSFQKPTISEQLLLFAG